MTVPRRILIVAHSPHRGGAEYCLQTTLEHLDRSRFQPLVVFPDEGPMVDSARLGCEVLVTPMCHWLYFRKGWWYWKNLLGRLVPNVRRLRRLIREREIDLVYTNTSAIFESAIAARLEGVPHVWHVHEVLQTGNRMQQLLPLRTMKRLIYRWSSRIVFESNAARTVFEDCTPADKSQVIYNSVRLDESPVDRQAARRRFGLRDEDVAVGFVGQFIDRKNPLLLIDAISRLPDAKRVHCLFAGDGRLRAEMESRISAHGLSNRCRLVGFQDDVRPFLNAIDVLALPSRQESFGLVLVEAAHYGKPVVACRSQGPTEIVVDGETGFLTPQDDAQALAAALQRLSESQSLRLRLGAAGRRRAQELFHPATNTRRLEDVFESELSRRPKRPVLAKA